MKECIERNNAQTGAENLKDGIASFLSGFGVYRLCVGEFVHKNADAIIAAFTIILAFSTIFLWRATRELVTGAESAERRQLRAYVGLDQISFESPSLNKKGLNQPRPVKQGEIFQDFIVVKVRNYGKTPAYDVCTFAYIAETDFARRLPDDFFTDARDTDIKSRDDLRPILARFILNPDQIELVKHSIRDVTPLRRAIDQERQIYIFGRIYYRDAYQRPWRTTFCYAWEPWHPSGERFVAYEDYNREDAQELEEWDPKLNPPVDPAPGRF
jgi:hypothetical protein